MKTSKSYISQVKKRSSFSTGSMQEQADFAEVYSHRNTDKHLRSKSHHRVAPLLPSSGKKKKQRPPGKQLVCLWLLAHFLRQLSLVTVYLFQLKGFALFLSFNFKISIKSEIFSELPRYFPSKQYPGYNEVLLGKNRMRGSLLWHSGTVHSSTDSAFRVTASTAGYLYAILSPAIQPKLLTLH